MAKTIILLSDGTGNAAAKVWRSNVWRLFESLDLTQPTQVAIYDDGVGTASFKPLALVGGAFGWGLKRNVIDLYAFLCRNYEPHANIFGFGFSRGAFTIRVVMGLVVNQGIISTERATTEVDLQRLARHAYRAYRAERFHTFLRIERPFRWLRDRLIATKDAALGRKPYDRAKSIEVPSIRFLGLWDTVAAYGLPIEEMTRGVGQWIWPLELPDRTLNPKVRRACHALSLDDERTTFHPVLWTEAGETSEPPAGTGHRLVEDERISQVWFAGVHANVGGGYPDDRLAHVSLTWMMREAESCGLKFKQAPQDEPDAMRRARSASDKDGRLYDSRQGIASYYRYGPRKIAELCEPHYTPVVRFLARLGGTNARAVERRFPRKDVVEIAEPKIHVSAIERMRNGAHAYAPIGFPPCYAVVDDRGQILADQDNPFETPAAAQSRAAGQERVWNLVWWRRVVYFLTLGASFNLVLFPLVYPTDRAAEFSSPVPIVPALLRVVSGFVPGFLGWWVDAFAANSLTFVVCAALAIGLMLTGVSLGARVADAMRGLWCNVLVPGSRPAPPPPHNLVFRLRTADAYRSLIWAMKRGVLPFLSALLIVYLGLAAANRLAFTLEDGAGLFCEGAPKPVPIERPDRDTQVPLTAEERQRHVRQTGLDAFSTTAFCWPTGIWLDERGQYVLTLTESTAGERGWRDGAIAADLSGFELTALPSIWQRITMFMFVPWRRDLSQPWFRPIARIGEEGADEYPLEPDARASVHQPRDREITARIRARRSGELFLYVNDAVIGIPGLQARAYDNNQGAATLKVERVR
jgi:uncharacterized protein (DUF2235 family)